MNQDINIEEVKSYNKALNGYKDQASKINAQIEYSSSEVNNLCAELTNELGIAVTVDNIQAIYDEYVAKINSTLETGTMIIAKIANEGGSVIEAQPSMQPSMPQGFVQQGMPQQNVVGTQQDANMAANLSQISGLFKI